MKIPIRILLMAGALLYGDMMATGDEDIQEQARRIDELGRQGVRDNETANRFNEACAKGYALLRAHVGDVPKFAKPILRHDPGLN
jgi:hypothetical protein